MDFSARVLARRHLDAELESLMSTESSGFGAGLSRRRFVQGLAVGGAVAGLGLWSKPSWALKSPGQTEVLSGTDFRLTIGETPMNFTGNTRTAITVNGSIPAPILRWREGDTVNLYVSHDIGRAASREQVCHCVGISGAAR